MHGDPSENLEDPREGLGNFSGGMVDPQKSLGDRQEACSSSMKNIINSI
jgi:hypothetical protein